MADSKSDLIMDGHFATNSAVIPLQNPLWDYACQLYSKPGMEAALLVLQDDHGADINLILQALWLASESKVWSKACIPNDYGKWVTEQVIPLRKMRRRLKTDWVAPRGVGFEDFRQHVKGLELKAEQYALAMLFTHIKQSKTAAGSIALNLIPLSDYLNISSVNFKPLIALLS